MVLALVTPYVPVLVIVVLWAVSLRPVLRAFHAGHEGREAPRGRVRATGRRRNPGTGRVADRRALGSPR
jgi:hypothetical protein